jgi:hypothetical protein
MAAIITNIIPQDNFEVVRDVIGGILLVELLNQKSLQGFNEGINIYQERVIPIQADESLYINVVFDSEAYSNFTATNSQGAAQYFIDVYTTGNADPDNAVTGDMDSATRLHRFLRMCRYILATDVYRTLGLTPGFIGNKQVTAIATGEPVHTADSNYSRLGRITFTVKMQETQATVLPEVLGGSDTMVKLQQTEHGYMYMI